MDPDLWASRLAAAKRQYSLQHHHNSQLDRLSIDDFEVEEEVRPDFPCPYCYEEYDIASLCSHLEDEHSFESKLAVCPICSVKRRRRLRRVAVPNSQALSLLSRDLREAHLQVLLGGGGYRSSSTNASNTVTDPFLSSLVLSFSGSEAEEISKSAACSADDMSLKKTTYTETWKSCFDSSLSYEEREQKMRQATVRSAFVQDLLLSILLND
ncbi:protein DEHYDRATION-INDUCED 19-like protein [Cinnamomum micranthum f. kanehirae]|uniref:Protein DEHYDRATION-INDUCED 19-like protein n=1 Tax=Cinnamomum micranthum f. kanehirae TaxID=337451 RepID=A0A443Q050_9MAGN|nr:protein DEHYDRATION-INDUCED 19-like protein [Cinnamomum micranthum f. kanehirae]